MKHIGIVFFLIFLTAVSSEALKTEAGEVPELSIPGGVPVPADNPLTEAKIKLGKKLFFDDMLSGDGTMSCASCHDPDAGWTTHTRYSPAYPTVTERRNSPTLVNTAYAGVWIWDGRAGSLDKQALGPMKNPLHMNQNLAFVEEEVRADPEYLTLFKEAFGGIITKENIGKAIASFERTIVSKNSPFDRFLQGEVNALSASAKNGLGLFKGKARCILCHNGPNLTDNGFHNLGVPEPDDFKTSPVQTSLRFDLKRTKNKNWKSLTEDIGRATITKKKEDIGRFKTPTLRHVAETWPYMHNGVFDTLDQLLAFYNAGGGDHPNKSSLLKPLNLTSAEIKDLKAFLESLTGKIEY